jgi:hypothetical protein
MILKRIKYEKEESHSMGYKELIKLMEEGHDIIGETNDELYFGVLNIDETFCTIIIDELEYKIPYGKIFRSLESLILYKNMTYKELLDSETILIYEVC